MQTQSWVQNRPWKGELKAEAEWALEAVTSKDRSGIRIYPPCRCRTRTSLDFFRLSVFISSSHPSCNAADDPVVAEERLGRVLRYSFNFFNAFPRCEIAFFSEGDISAYLSITSHIPWLANWLIIHLGVGIVVGGCSSSIHSGTLMCMLMSMSMSMFIFMFMA